MITKSAMITIAGRPNVGKSTLINRIVGEKVAIVSNKPQTTRNRICGVLNRGESQIVFMDTPGFHKPRTRLGDYMVDVVKESVSDVDAVLLLVEPIANIGTQEETLLGQLRTSGVPVVLVINKIDTVEKETLLAVMSLYSHAFSFDAIVPVSAKTGDGVEDLLKEVEKYAAPGPQLFPDGMVTDQPERQIIAEIIREKLLWCLTRRSPTARPWRSPDFPNATTGLSTSMQPSTAKRPVTKVSSSENKAPCSRRSAPWPVRTANGSWAQKSIWKPGSR